MMMSARSAGASSSASLRRLPRRRTDRLVEQTAIGADLPDRRPGTVRGCTRDRQLEKTRIAAVEDAKAIAPRLDIQIRPGLAVDDDRVAKELRDPERVGLGVGRRARSGPPVRPAGKNNWPLVSN